MKTMKTKMIGTILAALCLFAVFAETGTYASAASSAQVYSAVSAKLPIVTYAAPLSGSSKVYAYTDSSLRVKETAYYIDSFLDTIVITQLSSDGKAVLVSYPGTSTIRSKWFSADDILGISTVSVVAYTSTKAPTTYMMGSSSSVRTVGYIDVRDNCVKLGTRRVGSVDYDVTIYPVPMKTVNSVNRISYRIALVPTAAAGAPSATVAATVSTDFSCWNMVSPNASSTPLIITANTSWTASSNVSWLDLSSFSGSGSATVTLYVAANTSSARSGAITIKAGSATKTVTVNQPAGASTTVVLPQPGSFKVLSVPRYAQSGQSWSSASMGGTTVSSIGCAVCSVAMLEAYKKNPAITPSDIVARSGQLNSSGAMVWKVAGIATPSVKYATEAQYAKAIYDQINNDNPVIVQYDFRMHYVIAYGYQGVAKDAYGNPVVRYSNILIRDPASDNLQTLDQFVAKYGISGLLYYR